MEETEFLVGAILIPIVAAIIGGLIQNPDILGLGSDNSPLPTKTPNIAVAQVDASSPSPTISITPTPSISPTPTPTNTPNISPTPSYTPRPSVQPKPTNTEVPPDQLISVENFEDRKIDDWEHDSHWSIIDDGTGNKVWRALGTTRAFLTLSEDLDNYMIELSFVAIEWGSGSGGVWNLDFCGIRDSRRWYTIYSDPDFMGMTLMPGSSTDFYLGSSSQIIHREGEWHFIRMIKTDDLIGIQQDTEHMVEIEVEDCMRGIGLFTWLTEEIWFDDIRVWSLDTE